MDKHEDYYFQKAAKYHTLGDFYKYSDPQKHIYFYQKHYHYMCKWLMYQNQYIKRENTTPVTEKVKENAKVRFLHASPDAPDVDVHINGNPALRTLRYKNSSEYLELPYGSYKVEVYPAGTKNGPVISALLDVEAGSPYTVAAIGLVENLQLLTIMDDPSVPQSETKVRFWHLSPDAPVVDIAVKRGDVIFSNIEFTEITDYLGLTPMTVDLEVRLAGSKDVLLPLSRVNVKPDQAYTIVAVGLAEGTPTLEAIFLVP